MLMCSSRQQWRPRHRLAARGEHRTRRVSRSRMPKGACFSSQMPPNALSRPPASPSGARAGRVGDAADPFSGACRPFVSAVMTPMEFTPGAGGGTNRVGPGLTRSELYGWQVLVVPNQAPLRASQATLSQLRTARLGLGAVLIFAAFGLTFALRTLSRQRSALTSANAALAQATREVERASRNKSEFLAQMSHELRTPLNAIIGFADILQQRMFGELNEKQADYVGDIGTSGHHLLTLINDVLDLSKVEAGRMELEVAEFDLAEAVRGGLAFVRERAAANGVEIEIGRGSRFTFALPVAHVANRSPQTLIPA